MTCACGTRATAAQQPDVVDSLNQAFEFLGMPLLPQRFQDICGVATMATQAVARAERANALGHFNLDSDRSLPQAKRHRDAAVRMLRSFKANLDDRMKSKPWHEALKVINSPDPRQGKPSELLDELSASIDDQLMSSSLSPAACQEIKRTVASGIAVGKQGISQTLALLGRSVEEFENQLLSGGIETRINNLSAGGPGEPNIVAHSVGEYFACTAAATVVLIAATIACAYIPFCWCCIFPLLLAGFLAWIAACENIPR